MLSITYGGMNTRLKNQHRARFFKKPFNIMKKITIITLLIISSSLYANDNSPVVIVKPDIPLNEKKQTLQKRAFIWIKGHWKATNDNYKWVSGFWEKKRPGYIYIDGYWEKVKNGYRWSTGYWKKIDSQQWATLYN